MRIGTCEFPAVSTVPFETHQQVRDGAAILVELPLVAIRAPRQNATRVAVFVVVPQRTRHGRVPATGRSQWQSRWPGREPQETTHTNTAKCGVLFSKTGLDGVNLKGLVSKDTCSSGRPHPN